MPFFYSAHKDLNGLYWALGATCWAQWQLGLLLLRLLLSCACLTLAFLIEICVALKCFTFWLTIIALWEIEFHPSVAVGQVERELMLRKGRHQREAVCRGWLVTWGANWSVVETVRAVSGVTMGLAWRYKLSCLLHAILWVSSEGGIQPTSLLLLADLWVVKLVFKVRIFLNTSVYSGAIAVVWKAAVFGWLMSCCEAQFPWAWVMALLLTPHAA